MTVANELMLRMAADAIKEATGLDFQASPAGLAILAHRLQGKSINQLIAEIKAQD